MVELNQEKAIRLLCHTLGRFNFQDVEDSVQEVFLLLWKKPRPILSFWKWFIKVALYRYWKKTKAFNQRLRDLTIGKGGDLVDVGRIPVPVQEEEKESPKLEELISSLAPQKQQIVTLRMWGSTFEQINRELDCTHSKTIFVRSIKTLRREYGKLPRYGKGLKLSPQDREKVRELYQQGTLTQSQIAEIVGIGIATVSRLIRAEGFRNE